LRQRIVSGPIFWFGDEYPHGEPQPQHDADNMTPIDHLMQMQRQNSRARTFEPISKTKTEFRGPAREQCQYWIVGPNLHAGDKDTGIKRLEAEMRTTSVRRI
jgi:hypothetical protein